MRILFLLLFFYGGAASAQTSTSVEPRTAFLKSVVMPGWGHQSVGASAKTAMKWHFGAELGMIASYIGIHSYAGRLEENAFTYARSQAGVDLRGRSRSFRLSVSRFNSLEAFNAEMLRIRNWDAVLPDTPENQWNWNNTDARERYNNRRSAIAQAQQQLPALIGLMTLNRVISSVSAYQAAKKQQTPNLGLSFAPVLDPLSLTPVYQARVTYAF